MKRKAQRVPDFSSAKKPVKGAGPTVPGAPVVKPAVAPVRTTAKPQATSSKSGHRGS